MCLLLASKVGSDPRTYFTIYGVRYYLDEFYRCAYFFTTCGTKSRFTRNFKFMSATAQRALINNESFIN